MNLKSRLLLTITLLLSCAGLALAGNLDSLGPPESGSGMPTLKGIYDRLDTGTFLSVTGGFAEPSAGPTAGTGVTLNNITSVLPQPDNVNGLAPANAPNGKTFWGLRTDGTWGPQTGSNANVVDTTSGDAVAANLSYGKTAWVDGNEITGILYAGVTCTGTLDGTRWCDNGNGTVTDLTTGLVWLKNANCFGTKKWVDSSTWDDAQTASGMLKSGSCGLTDGSVEGDWHLLTKNELYVLSHGTEQVRSGTPRAFTGVQANFYWSATTYSFNTFNAWVVNLSTGGVNVSNKANSYYVWPVRTGQ